MRPAAPRHMALKRKVAKLEDIEERYRALYTQQSDGTYQLDAEIEGTVPKEKLDEFRNNNIELQKVRERLEKALGGKSPEEIEALIKAQTELEEKKRRAEGEFDTLKTQLIEQHKRELGERDGMIKKLRGAVTRMVAENALMEELTKAKGNPALLKANLLPFVQVKEEAAGEELRFAAVVLDDRGQPRVKDGSGSAFTIADLVAEKKAAKEYAPAFEGNGASGSGASGSGSPAGGGASDLSTLPPAARIAEARRRGITK